MTKTDIEFALAYVQMTITKIETKYKDPQFFLGADINHVDVNLILNLNPNFHSLNKNATRGRKNIDVFITNMAHLFQQGQVCQELQVDGLKSDHKQLLILKRLTNQSTSSKEIEYRPILESGIRDFSEYLSNCQWSPMEALFVDNIVETIDTVVNNGLDTFLPLKKKKIKNNSQPWFSRELENMKRLKSAEYKKEGRSLKYKQLDKEYQSKLKAVKIEYKAKFLDEAIKAKNPRNAFKALKKLSGAKETQNNFILPGWENKSDFETSNLLCEFFSSISNEYKALDIGALPDRVKIHLKSIDQVEIPQFGEEQVFQQLNKMKIPSSMVQNDLPPKVLKEVLIELTCPLTILINACLRDGVFPKAFKTETTICIPKVNPPSGTDELRNLGLTRFFSKFLEAMLITLLTPYLRGDEAQFGGEKNTSTGHYLLELIEFILEAWETTNETVIAICLDFSKGYNRILHSRLVTILSDMGVPAYLLIIIISYLSNREMQVRHNGVFSDKKDLRGGSPQGALFSVIFFCIYSTSCGMSLKRELKTTDREELPELPVGQKMRTRDEVRVKYVDDASVAVKLLINELLKKKDEMIIPEFLFNELEPRQLTEYEMCPGKNKMHEKIEDIEAFTHLNYMKLNEKKSKILFCNNRRKDSYLQYKLNGKDIEQVDVIKLIGFQFQSNLKIDAQLNYLKTKVNSRIWGLRMVMENGGDHVSGKMYYISMVRSLLEVNVEIWNGRLTAKNVLDLEKIQIRCFKLILKNKYQTYNEALTFFELDRLSTRRESLCLSFIRKAVKYHPELYPLQEIHTTRLGDKRPVIVPKYKKGYHELSGKVYLCRLYNNNL